MGTIADLLNEQVGFSNIIVLNKQDLVTDDQREEILERISVLNPKAKILPAVQSKIDVLKILNTGLYTDSAMFEESFRFSVPEEPEEVEIPDCCEESVDPQAKKCCEKSPKSNDRVLESEHSKAEFA